jgi:hypothetical protein
MGLAVCLGLRGEKKGTHDMRVPFFSLADESYRFFAAAFFFGAVFGAAFFTAFFVAVFAFFAKSRPPPSVACFAR